MVKEINVLCIQSAMSCIRLVRASPNLMTLTMKLHNDKK